MTKKKKKQIQKIIFHIATIVSIGLACSSLVYASIHQYSIYKGIYLLVGSLLIVISITYFLYFHKKKLKKRMRFFTSVLAFILIMTSLISLYENKIPVDGYHGIDISKWNEEVDLSSATIDFVIIRCGYTSKTDAATTKPDEYFKRNISLAKELGIPYGVYYYSCATNTTQAKKEANYVINMLQEDIPPLGVYIDMEDPTHQEPLETTQLMDIATTFLETVEQKGHRGGVYANYYWWNHKLDKEALNDYLKWIAIYDDAYEHEEDFDIHQYSDHGTIPGLMGEFDVNTIKRKFW